jgi:hypothetical protein
MTSSNTLKKLVSIGAAMLLAVGGSLVAAEPALASTVVTWDAGTGGTVDANGQQSFVETVSGASITSPTAMTRTGCTITGWQEWRTGTMFSNRTFPLSLTMTTTIELRPVWSCPMVLTTAPTAVISGASAVATAGVWAGGTVMGEWKICGLSVTAGSNTNGYFNGSSGGCDALFTSSQGNTRVSSATLSLTGSYYRQGNAQAVVLSGSKLLWLEYGSSDTNVSAYANTATISVPLTLTVAPPVTATVVAPIAESAKPLPVWAAPILKQIPTLSKTLTTEGGKLSLKDGDYSSLKSVTVGGKEVAYSIDAKGDVNIPVPAGKGGTFADLVVTFTGGKMTVQDGIKYVEPTNVATVREAPIAGFKGTSTKITGALAESIQYAAQLDKKANTVLCTGYAASKAAVATATARAEAACGYATKVNDQLVNKKVTIVVNAKLAKTASVGIKVYK